MTLNEQAESKIILLEQDLSTGYYRASYEFKHVGIYKVRFYLNGYIMQQEFLFQAINHVISPLYTETKLLGYLTFSELDCMFVNRPFYVVFNMKDQFSNDIPYTDKDAFVPVIKAELTQGIYYDNEKCKRYTPESNTTILCQFEALMVGDD